MSNKIKEIKAREILDSRGNPTIEVELYTKDRVFVDSVPSGASVGKREVLELRDGGERYLGKGVLKAIKNVKLISNELEGFRVDNQKEIDEKMIEIDHTEKKSKLGANAMMGVSLASARAGADFKKQHLFSYIGDISGNDIKMPSLCFNILNGGMHAGNDLAFQEFMINFEGFTVKEQVKRASEVYHTLKDILKEKYGRSAINVGDEGGFAPSISDPEVALKLILEACESLNYRNDVFIFLDIAASSFYKEGKYTINSKSYDKLDLVEYYKELCSKYPIKSIEDPFVEDDFEAFKILNQAMNGDLLIIGDDLTTTNIKSMEKAYIGHSINGLLVKINQIGTVSEALEAANLAKSYNWKVMVSHRSGDTIDDFIADFAVGIGAEYIKSGAPARGERIAKYNRLMKIEDLIKKGL